MILNWFTKKSFLITSFVLILVFSITYLFNYYSVSCYRQMTCSFLVDMLIFYTFIFIPVFVFALITFFMKQGVFNAWRNFSIFAVVISLVAISFLPSHSYGLDILPLTKGTGVFLLSIAYSVISLFIIIFKAIQLRGQGR